MPSDKHGVGAAWSRASRVWYTIRNGSLTEIYYPTIDRPQVKRVEYIITDGEGKVWQESRDFGCVIERMNDSLGFRIRSEAADRRVELTKELIADPALPCVLVMTRVTAATDLLRKLRLYVLCESRLGPDGSQADSFIADIAGQPCLVAHSGGRWLVVASSNGFTRRSCGFMGYSDGWTDLLENGEMDWQFGSARNGSVALTGEVDTLESPEFVLAIAFGQSFEHASTVMLQALGLQFENRKHQFLSEWDQAPRVPGDVMTAAGDGGRLAECSQKLILAHEDKTYHGAFIASLSVPWGQAIGGGGVAAGYHLVWTRDLFQASTALLACGQTETPLRSLMYLAASQDSDGSYPQNFWIDGRPHWQGIQLDEIAYPMILARMVARFGGLQRFNPLPTVSRAAAWLIEQGPVTPQERWEELSGYSPSTLAVTIAGLISTACFLREAGDEDSARVVEDYADFLWEHLIPWTVTCRGGLVAGLSRYFVRINPRTPGEVSLKPLDEAVLKLQNQPPGQPDEFPAREIVDSGFLLLARFGVLPPDHAVIVESLQVIDRVLRVETPFGPAWHRFNYDGYGDKSPSERYGPWGHGRAWPLLTGERGHYELAAGRDPMPYVRAVEGFATSSGLLPEQVWDVDDPAHGAACGRPTASAMPLLWAHAEYLKLLRSRHDGRCFDLVPEVEHRYRGRRQSEMPMEMWTFRYQIPAIKRGQTVRITARTEFVLHWSADEWQTSSDKIARSTRIGIYYIDLTAPQQSRGRFRFTFRWTIADNWEHRDFEIAYE